MKETGLMPDTVASAGRHQGFAACVREYGSLAKDATRWADQVNGLQGYVRALGQ